MRNFFENLSYKLMQFMQGRNGSDRLAQWAFGAGVVFTLLDLFFGSIILSTLGLVCLAYSVFRCVSRNIGARATENARFEAWLRKPTASVNRARAHWANRSTTKYFKCKQCGQSLSVPKGKGTLRTTCPKCGTQATVKS